MSGSTLGTLFTVTSFGESHGPAIGCVVDGCPPGMALTEADIQVELDRRKPGTSRHVTQRREDDVVEILSGVFEGRTTGTPIGLLIRNVDARCRATIGEVGNAEQSNINWGKAGRMRWKGVRPTVRGVAMNPVDHPHGGGEGKTSGGRHPVSPWGQSEGRTRRPKKESNKLIVRRRTVGKKR
jgi:hypothetical protein